MSDTVNANLAAWVEQINAALGTSFEIEEPGKLFVEFESGTRVGVDFPDGAESYDIYAPVGDLGSMNDLPKLATALQLNLFQRGTAGGVIGLDQMSGVLVYSFTAQVATSSPQALAAQLEKFVEHVERLRAEIEHAQAEPSEAERSDLMGDLGFPTGAEDNADEPAKGSSGGAARKQPRMIRV